MVSAEHNYSHLTVQRVQAANNRDYTVLFLLTGRPCERGTTMTQDVLIFLYLNALKIFTATPFWFGKTELPYGDALANKTLTAASL